MQQPLTVINSTVAANQSMSATFTTATQNVNELNGYAFQITWSGTSPVGTITLECSNVDSNAYFVEITGTSTAISGNNGSTLINVINPNYQFVRMVYTRTSGTATADIKFSGKRT